MRHVDVISPNFYALIKTKCEKLFSFVFLIKNGTFSYNIFIEISIFLWNYHMKDINNFWFVRIGEMFG